MIELKKYEYVTIPEEVEIPEHIIDATFINPPIEVIELVGLISSKSFVCFYEHLKIEQVEALTDEPHKKYCKMQRKI